MRSNKRRLYLPQGFSSLHDYCVREPKYSAGAAQRRIQSMRLLVEMPEVENSVREGKLSLCTLSTVQRFFNAQAKIHNSKSEDNQKETLNQNMNENQNENQNHNHNYNESLLIGLFKCRKFCLLRNFQFSVC